MKDHVVSVVDGEADEEDESDELTAEEILFNFVEKYRSSELTKLNLVASNLIQQQTGMLRTEESVDLQPFQMIEEYLGKVRALKARVKKVNVKRESIKERLQQALANLKG